MKKLLRQAHQSKPIMLGLTFVIVLFLLAGAFFLGDKHGLENMTFKRVTPAQVATAMKDDHFYSSYRENTLIVHGTISSISNNGGNSIVEFKTASSFKASCDFGTAMPNVHQGDSVTVFSEAAAAERQPSGVLLKDCLIP